MSKFKPGVSFGDFVIEDFSRTKSRVREETPRDFRRGWLVWLMIVVAFGVLVVRLIDIQIFQGSKYRVLAEENRIRILVVPAPRGKILDRNKLELAGNGDSRRYQFGAALAHTIGYMSEVSEEEEGTLKEAGQKYRAGEWIGRSGLEYQYEKQLRGLTGGRLVEVDINGNTVRELGNKAPLSGQDLQTSLDGELSQVAYEALGGKKGAVVASNPQTGEVIILVSSPSFDPGQIANYLTDPNLPMFNRAIGGVYPPGSTFKVITTAAAIESGKVKADFTFKDEGQIVVGQYKYTNWLFTRGGGTEGVVGFTRAIVRSTDTFFYEVGGIIGPTIIYDWAKKFGLAEKTGIDIPGEVKGIVDNPQWRQVKTGEKWFLGNSYHLAIGQGHTLSTPLQVNLMTNVIAAKGKRCQPHLVKLPITNDSQCDNVQISEKSLKIIIDGLVGACSPGGTAFPLFDFEPKVACKTGTSEYVAESGKMRTHGWLTAYAPVDDPTISVTVVVEGGGEGSNVAAPIVRKIMARYFNVEDNYNYAAIPQEMGE